MIHLNRNEHSIMEALHKLADEMEIAYTDEMGTKQLAQKIAAVEVTTEI